MQKATGLRVFLGMLCALPLLGAVRQPRIRARPSPVAAREICKGADPVCRLAPPLLTDAADVQRFANQLLNAYTAAGLDSDLPGAYGHAAWEDWETKDCVMNGTNCPTSTVGHRVLLRSIRQAVQTDLSINPLASVFYNKIASGGIKLLPGPLDMAQPMPPLQPGSVIVKAVWDMVPKQATMVLLANDQTVASEREPDGTTQYDFRPTALLHPHFEAINMSPAQNGECAGAATKLTDIATTYRECIHFVVVQTAPEQVDIGAEVRSTCVENKDCYAFLSGINMMVKTQEGGNWIWITMWWTGHDNAQSTQRALTTAPWKNYTYAVTTSNRDDPPATAAMPNILYNPYLEAFSPNGKLGNCVTCHSYAAVSRSGTHPSKVSAAKSNLLGSPDFPVRLSPADSLQARSKFKADALSTDSVWSIADRVPSKTSAPKP